MIILDANVVSERIKPQPEWKSHPLCEPSRRF
jgi:predicted nucleic acid-binding protein